MRVLGLSWLGTRTADHTATVDFFHRVLGLEIQHDQTDFTGLVVPGGAAIEVFGPATPCNPHMTHPVLGFRVDDLSCAADELVAAGIEIVLPIERGDTGAWLHFRAPDGFVYELNQEF